MSRRADTVEDVFLQLETKNDELAEELLVWQSGQHQASPGMNTENAKLQEDVVESQRGSLVTEHWSGKY